MAVMQVLYGPSPLSEFRRRQLLARLQPACAAVSGLRAAAVYFLDMDGAPGGAARRRLESLLAPDGGLAQTPADAGAVAGVAGAIAAAAAAADADTTTTANATANTAATATANITAIYIIPRTGTVSPWSSKATDIFHVCGLQQVRRVERGVCYGLSSSRPLSGAGRDACAALLHDRMTEEVCYSPPPSGRVFARAEAGPLREVALDDDPRARLAAVNRDWGLALSPDEMAYLLDYYRSRARAPTDAELMMFAQANSEHCRHKLFNAEWMLGGRRRKKTLFEMIRHTHACAPHGVLSAYEDNAAVIAGAAARRLVVDTETRRYRCIEEPQPILMKVETHNHPTAISPFAGAATGAGGEIRDEAATGRGGRPKAGLTGFSVSNLRIPGFVQPWEGAENRPSRIASPLQIMMEAPIGGANYNNEFGRPNLCGYFRTFEHAAGGQTWGYHKPVMVAGGLGTLRAGHVAKRAFADGTPLVVFGGPAMLIGLGGGSASSVGGGASSEQLDFASVQRDNAEIQRRCQEVIEQCAALGDDNPVLAIHDVGAGGLANALPELVHGAGLGGHFQLRDIPCADGGLSPMEIWCNEAQERYVAAIDAARLPDFLRFCERERCPAAVIGSATARRQLVVADRLSGRDAVDMPLPVLLGNPPRGSRSVAAMSAGAGAAALDGIGVDDAAERVLKMPAVASKSFLITIGDRSVGGLVARDQMAGPWQVPVADAAVTAADYSGYAGEAMAMGERTPVAVCDAPASGRLAVAEALLNLLSADVRALGDVRLSANWMAAAGDDAQAAALFETVRAVAQELCPELGIAIPVGKDSLSMQMAWRADGRDERVVSPLSLVVSAFAPVGDVRNTLTPQLRPDAAGARLWLVDLGGGKNRLGGSCLMQAWGRTGGAPPDLDAPQKLASLFALLRELRERGMLLAYHDRSDGGLFACLAEMAFAGHCGVRCDVGGSEGGAGGEVGGGGGGRADSGGAGGSGAGLLAALFAEELGVVIQVAAQAAEHLPSLARRHGLAADCRDIGCCIPERKLEIRGGEQSHSWDLMQLKRWWSETGFHIRALRDHPDCAAQELNSVCDGNDPGLSASLTFNPSDDSFAAASSAPGAQPAAASAPGAKPAATPVAGARSASAPMPGAKPATPPKVAVLREQGVNGQMEMAAAFVRAGFEVCDVHMSDLIAGREDLRSFHGLAACGGFSYGDVLGAGAGWAQSVLLHGRVRDAFAGFLARDNTFVLGVCNGCQMLSRLSGMVPGAGHWPRFRRNRSDRFEGRLVMVEIVPSPSILLAGMEGSMLPVVVAHGEGRAVFNEDARRRAQSFICLRYLDNDGRATERYPHNPNGSAGGVTGLCNEDGRVTIMMPHPERLFRSCQHSWHPPGWGEEGPWLRLFQNARRWLAA